MNRYTAFVLTLLLILTATIPSSAATTGSTFAVTLFANIEPILVADLPPPDGTHGIAYVTDDADCNAATADDGIVLCIDTGLSWEVVGSGGGGVWVPSAGALDAAGDGDLEVTVTEDGELVATGTFGVGAPVGPLGAGTRLLWHPRKAALRAGQVQASQFDEASVGDHSIGLGRNALASGEEAVAIGGNSNAGGVRAFAIGSSTEASGAGAFAIGGSALADGDQASAFGNGATASGQGSTALGNFATADGALSIAIGDSVGAWGNRSLAIGSLVNADSFREVVLGSWNLPSEGNPTSWVTTDPAFVVGIGQSFATRANALTLRKSGALELMGPVTVGGTSVCLEDGTDCPVGGSSAFSGLTSGTNTTAAMVVGTGASVVTSGSGTITATSAATASDLTCANCIGGTEVDESTLVIDHGTTTGLLDDDHTQYPLLAGRAGGQTLIGGTGTTDDLILRTTSGVGASGADMILQVGNNGATEAVRILNSGSVGIGTSAPQQHLHVKGNLRVSKTTSDATYMQFRVDGDDVDIDSYNSRFFINYGDGKDRDVIIGSAAGVGNIRLVPGLGKVSLGYGVGASIPSKLSVSGTTTLDGRTTITAPVTYTPQAVTCTDSGDGNPGAVTITPTTSFVTFTNSDPDGCDPTLSETGAVSGQSLEVIVMSTAGGAVTFSDSAGVQETGAGCALSLHGVATFRYSTDRWILTGCIPAN